jgi:hypothetical protein
MNRLVLLSAICMAFSGPALAQRNPNAAASAGDVAAATAALEARIASLESAVAVLSAPQGGVAGHTYLSTTFFHNLWRNASAPEQGASLSVSQSLMEFRSNGTGETTSLICDGYRLHDPDSDNVQKGFLVSAPFCGGSNSTYTYTQVGNVLTITSTGSTAGVKFTVADDGGVYTVTNASLSGCTNVPAPCSPNGYAAVTVTAVRVE